MQTFENALKYAAKLHSEEKFQEAIDIYDQLLGKDVENPYLLYLLGTAFAEQKKNGIAIPLLARSLHLNRNNAEAWNNLGICYREEGHEENAALLYQEALRLDPKNADTWANYSGVYVNYGNPEKCIEIAKRALEIDPNHVRARHNTALALLEKGSFEEGWDWYEARFGLKDYTNRDYKVPRWDGSHVKRLAIHGEQGLGDEIMFMSCFRDAQEFVDYIVVECAPRLVTLFSRSFQVKCYETHEELIKNETVDAYIPMGSLPKLFRRSRESFPKHNGYLVPNLNRILHYESLVNTDKPKIGLSWKGGTKKTHEHLRTIPLRFWKDILKQDAMFISLQYGDHDWEVKEHGLVHFPEAFSDLDELTALAATCDLVITVDQTLVHQCGAVGIPCWVLTPSKPSFRYGLSGDMAWYPSVKLYRQKDKWDEVLKNVSQDLRTYCADYRELPRLKQAAT